MTENMNNGCSQRDSAEHEGYAKASRSFNRIWKERDSAQPKLLEAILYKDNLNRAYKMLNGRFWSPPTAHCFVLLKRNGSKIASPSHDLTAILFKLSYHSHTSA